MVGWEASIGLASRVSGKPAVKGSSQRVSRPGADCSEDLHSANTSIICALNCFLYGCEFDVVATPWKAMCTQGLPCGSCLPDMPAFSSASVDFAASPMRFSDEYRLFIKV